MERSTVFQDIFSFNRNTCGRRRSTVRRIASILPAFLFPESTCIFIHSCQTITNNVNIYENFQNFGPLCVQNADILARDYRALVEEAKNNEKYEGLQTKLVREMFLIRQDMGKLMLGVENLLRQKTVKEGDNDLASCSTKKIKSSIIPPPPPPPLPTLIPTVNSQSDNLNKQKQKSDVAVNKTKENNPQCSFTDVIKELHMVKLKPRQSTSEHSTPKSDQANMTKENNYRSFLNRRHKVATIFNTSAKRVSISRNVRVCGKDSYCRRDERKMKIVD